MRNTKRKIPTSVPNPQRLRTGSVKVNVNTPKEPHRKLRAEDTPVPRRVRETQGTRAGALVSCPIDTCSLRGRLPPHFIYTRLRPFRGVMNRERRKTGENAGTEQLEASVGGQGNCNYFGRPSRDPNLARKIYNGFSATVQRYTPRELSHFQICTN